MNKRRKSTREYRSRVRMKGRIRWRSKSTRLGRNGGNEEEEKRKEEEEQEGKE